MKQVKRAIRICIITGLCVMLALGGCTVSQAVPTDPSGYAPEPEVINVLDTNAPVFWHGDGIWYEPYKLYEPVEGEVIQTAPGFMDEKDGVEFVREELARWGLICTDTQETFDFTDLNRPMTDPDAKSEYDDFRQQTREESQRFDLALKYYDIPVEFVSMSDCINWKQSECGADPNFSDRADIIGAANALSTWAQEVNKGKTHGIFYDPVQMGFYPGDYGLSETELSHLYGQLRESQLREQVRRFALYLHNSKGIPVSYTQGERDIKIAPLFSGNIPGVEPGKLTLSEEDALQIIQDEFKAHGIRCEAGRVKPVVTPVPIPEKLKESCDPGEKMIWSITAWQLNIPGKNIYIKFISRYDYYGWAVNYFWCGNMTEEEKKWAMEEIQKIKPYTFEDMARFFQENLYATPENEGVYATLYDPCSESLHNILEVDAAANDAQIAAESSKNSERLLRTQVRELITWLQDEGLL